MEEEGEISCSIRCLWDIWAKSCLEKRWRQAAFWGDGAMKPLEWINIPHHARPGKGGGGAVSGVDFVWGLWTTMGKKKHSQNLIVKTTKISFQTLLLKYKIKKDKCFTPSLQCHRVPWASLRADVMLNTEPRLLTVPKLSCEATLTALSEPFGGKCHGGQRRRRKKKKE